MPAIHKAVDLLLLVLPIFITLFVYYPVMENGLGFDEVLHLYTLENFGAAELILSPHGGHLSYITNVSYLLLHNLIGIDARFFFGLVLISHLTNVTLITLICKRFTGNSAISAAAAILWGASPMLEGTLSWFAVYGQILMTGLILWIIFDIAELKDSDCRVSSSMQIRWFLLLIAALGCFGFAIGIVPLFFVALYFLLPKSENNKSICIRFTTLLPVTVLIYGLVHVLYNLYSDRVPLHGVSQVMTRNDDFLLIGGFKALSQLFSYGVTNILFFGLTMSDLTEVLQGPLKGWPMQKIFPLSEWIALLWLLAIVGVIKMRNASLASHQAVALIGLAIASYSVFAGWGALSGRFREDLGVSPIFQAITPRYHYFTTSMIIIATIRIFHDWASSVEIHSKPGTSYITVILVLSLYGSCGIASYLGFKHVRQSGYENVLSKSVEEIHSKIRRSSQSSVVYLPNVTKAPATFYKTELFPGSVAIFMIAFPENEVEGKRVFFVEKDIALLHKLRAEPDKRVSQLVAGEILILQ